MRAKQQIAQANALGVAAHAAGNKCIPAHDPAVIPMLKGRFPGQTPPGEASTVQILDAWLSGWHTANNAEDN